jgi:hypothetical protein
MDWTLKGRTIFLSLAALAVLVAGLGVFLPDIRTQLFLKPRRDRAEATVTELAVRLTALRRKQGRYDTFTPVQASQRMQALGISNIPSQDFLFDANLLPDKGLRLRALPRADSVRDLRVSPQMYVAELAPAGGVRRSGWVP